MTSLLTKFEQIFVGRDSACVVGASAPYNHGVPLAGASRRCHVGLKPDLRSDAGMMGWQTGTKIPRLAIALLSALLHIFPCAAAHAAPPTEYEVKAAFIHNIASFVKWPAAPSAEGKLRLCILGSSPFTEAAGVLVGEQIDGLVWEVQHVDSRSALQECRVLFIAASEGGNLRRILQGVEGRAVLTVGDSDGYAEQGVVVNFYSGQNKVRFEINEDAARRAGLKISSQLLKLARIVRDAGGVK